MKKTILTVVLTLCLVSILGLRGRYYPVESNYAVDTASSDTYVATVQGIIAYDAGLVIWLNPVTDNTGACTLNINGLGAKSLKTVLGQDPGNNHIDAVQIVPLCYDGTNFIILTPNSNP